jgi:nicotinamidase-related amidase
MSEELEQQPEVAPDQPEEVQLSPIQVKAIEQGWKPKDQFEGDEGEFIDAPEFVRRGELFGKIEHQSRELKAVKQALDALKLHNSKIEQSAYDRALKALKDERKNAILEGETSRAFELEDQIEDVQKERERVAREAHVPAVQEVDPAFTRWVEANPWYTKDVAMQAVADRVGIELARRNVPQNEVLRKVEEEVRAAFPHKFANPKRERASAVEPSSRGGTSVAKTDVALDEDERRIMRKIVATGVMTEAEYKSQLKKVKDR